MQNQVWRYVRFFIFGCGGILLLLMLLYGPWMIQAKQITIPDISIANFMIRDTSSFFSMHQEAAEQLIGESKAVLSATEAGGYHLYCCNKEPFLIRLCLPRFGN